MGSYVNEFFNFLNRIKYHILGTAVYIICEVKFVLLNGAPKTITPFLIFYSVDVSFFFLNCYWFFPEAFRLRKTVYKPILIVFLSLAIQIALKLLVTAMMQPGKDDFWGNLSWKLVYNYTWRATMTAGISTLLWGWINFVALLKREKIYENNALYARISPHLFYNSLNFAHAMVLPHSDEAAEMLTLMTEYARFAMAELAEDGKTGFEVELAQLNILIKMMRLRFKNLNLDFKIDISPAAVNYRVPPQIIISLAENVFKYGVLEDADKYVLITIHEKEGLLFVGMSNWKTVNEGAVSSKIGLDLVRKRLKNIYGKSAELKIEDSADYFKIKLTIQL